jgi:hypothetical protein
MYRGTVLEGDADVNRIMTNTMDGGVAKMGFGFLALVVGAAIAAVGRASQSKADESTRSSETRDSGSA